MKLEINTQFGPERHTLNSYQNKKFKEWFENPNSPNVFTYWKAGYNWHIIKPQIINLKYIED
ncbi:hypothetical protein KQI86_00180 [Clostridium sp. MSJ-11]|uniref:Uncharacterized protein n=1 Tax=Clostridium mobile TaxID=2841512 RepID=A0ABS6EBZ7_9CLOT|nr:hypothetical protein [Clostridium mobile]MBU5482717.1 hypothetical protein [Clostridium mobile]